MKRKLFTLSLAILLLAGCNTNKPDPIVPPDPKEYNTADYYGGYYSSITSWTNGQDLINQLNAVIRNGYTALNYDDPNWESCKDADHALDDYEMLNVIYGADDVLSSYTNTKWQREHAFCASLMTGSLTSNAVKFPGRATDFHNLFAANMSGNTGRGNKNYGVADKTDSSYLDFTVNNGADGYSSDSDTFEPGNTDKGRVARAIFYMCTMYKDDEVDTVNNKTMKGLTIQEENVTYSKDEEYTAFAIGGLSTLLSWSDTYQVDRQEMQHNISVYTYEYKGVKQGNRNPYIDYPELVDYAFGSKKNDAGELKYVRPSCLDIGSNNNEIYGLAIKSAKRTYEVGSSYSIDDIKVLKVCNDFTFSEITATSSAEGHIFSSNDTTPYKIDLTMDNLSVSYYVDIIQPMSSYSYQTGNLTTSTFAINKAAGNSGVDKTITINNQSWITNYVCADSSKAITFSNISAGGVTLGSGTNALTKLTFTSSSALKVDAAFISAASGIKGAYFDLVIKVGETTFYSSQIDDNSGTKSPTKIYGNKKDSALSGVVSFIITPSSSNPSTTLKLGSFALNIVTD